MEPKDLPEYTYSITLTKDEESWEARCLEIPGLTAYGDMPMDAFDEIQTAVCGWLEVLEMHEVEFPKPGQRDFSLEILFSPHSENGEKNETDMPNG